MENRFINSSLTLIFFDCTAGGEIRTFMRNSKRKSRFFFYEKPAIAIKFSAAFQLTLCIPAGNSLFINDDTSLPR